MNLKIREWFFEKIYTEYLDETIKKIANKEFVRYIIKKRSKKP